MPRMTARKRSELESFWRAHLDGWRRSDLNQREYCDLHGPPLTRFGNWRAKLKYEEPTSAGKLLYRRGGGLSHMTSHMTKSAVPAPAILGLQRRCDPRGESVCSWQLTKKPRLNMRYAVDRRTGPGRLRLESVTPRMSRA